jgi:hypothetical protein
MALARTSKKLGLFGTSLTPHSMGLNKILKPLDPIVRPLLNYNAEKRLKAAINIADLRVAAEKRMHVSS